MVGSTSTGNYPVSQGELDAFWALAGNSSVITVLFHTRIAEKLRISPSDLKCLHLVVRAGEPVSAGRIAELAGLSTGAVTGVIDRLEQAGYARRIRDPQDRRKVIVEATVTGQDDCGQLLKGTMETLRRVLSRYSPQQRQLIHDYNVDLQAEMRKEVQRFAGQP